MIILSICIPTYNRGEITINLVKELLLCKDSRFEIVVLDNSSTDGSYEELLSIKNSKLKIFRNNENIGSSPNVVKSILFAEGKYSIVCLDKDRLLIDKLPDLIDYFDKSNYIMGRCKLFSTIESPNIILKNGVKSLITMAFSDTHPTGHFYKTTVYKDSEKVHQIIQTNDQFGFYFELINAKIALQDSAVIINSIYFDTESEENRKKFKSMSFAGKNIYFDPKGCKARFIRYYEELYQLNLPFIIRNYITIILFYRYLNSAIFNYKKIMMNNELCEHYCIPSKYVSKSNMFSILAKSNKTLIQTHKYSVIFVLPFVLLINLFVTIRVLKS